MANSPLRDTDGVITLSILSDGQEIKDTIEVISARTSAKMGHIPKSVFTLATPGFVSEDFPEAESAYFEPGAGIEIKAGYDGKNETIFKGVVVAKRMRVNSSEGARLEITAYDKVIALNRVRKTVLFEKKKDSEIMSSIASDAELTKDISATIGDPTDQIQNDVTDWDFLRHLANRNGYVLWAQNGKLIARKPDTSANPDLAVTLGVDLIDFDARVDTLALVTSASGAAWSSSDLERVRGESGRLPDETWGNKSSKEMAETLQERDHHFATPRDVDAGTLETYARARALQSALSAMQGSCSFAGSARAVLGAMLEFHGVGDRFGGTAFIGGVEHEIAEGTWTTKASLGLEQDWASDMSDFGAPAAKSLATPIHGTQIGTVTQLTEDPEGRLRIKVKLVMIGDDGSEVWARFAQPYSSKEAGFQFMPEIGDEVVVTFLDADPQAPIVIGSLHNGKATRPNQPTEENAVKAIVTRSNLRVSFDDEKKSISLTTPGGQSVVMDDDTGAITMKDSHNNSITMNASGISIESAGDVTIKAGANADVSADGDASIRGTNVNCRAELSLECSGGATASLDGGGETTVTGAMVMIN